MSQTPDIEVQWMTPEDLAALLQISVGTVSNWRSQQKGPEFKRFGGLVRYRTDVVNAWIEDQPSK